MLTDLQCRVPQTRDTIIRFGAYMDRTFESNTENREVEMHFLEMYIFVYIFVIIESFTDICSIDSKSALVQVMAWHQTGTKPSPEPMLTQCEDAIWRHQALVFIHCPSAGMQSQDTERCHKLSLLLAPEFVVMTTHGTINEDNGSIVTVRRLWVYCCPLMETLSVEQLTSDELFQGWFYACCTQPMRDVVKK